METKNNIAVNMKFDDSIYFKAMCDCGENSHIHTLELSKDGDDNFKEISLALYANVSYDYWNEKFDSMEPWYNQIYMKIFDYWRRIKKAIVLIFTGYIKAEEYFMFQSEEQIRDYINALEEGIVYLNGKEEKRN